MSSPDTAKAAQLLLAVHRGGAPLAELPEGARPETLEQAYAIQDGVIRELGRIGGWKVSPMRPNATPGCAPIAADKVHAGPADLSLAALPFCELEGEVAVKLGQDLPPRATPYTAEELRGAIAALHPAFELMNPRYVDRKAVTPLSGIADSQSTAGIVYGPAVTDWQGLDLANLPMRMTIGGAEVGTANSGADAANMLGALAWLANHAAARTGGLRKGDVIITGSRISPRAVGKAATTAVLEVTGLGSVEARFA